MDQPREELAGLGFAAAFNSVRLAKNLCMGAIAVALVLQLTGFALVHYVKVLDATGGAEQACAIPDEAPPAETAPTTTPATVAAGVAAPVAVLVKAPAPVDDSTPSGAGSVVVWNAVLTWAFGVTEALTPILGVLLVMLLFLALQLSLLGRLGGQEGLTSALLWSLILLIMLSPWQRVFPDRFACGALYGLGELLAHMRKLETNWILKERAYHYVRFVALAVVTLLVWLMVLLKSASGRNSMTTPTPISAAPSDAEDMPMDPYEGDPDAPAAP